MPTVETDGETLHDAQPMTPEELDEALSSDDDWTVVVDVEGTENGVSVSFPTEHCTVLKSHGIDRDVMWRAVDR